MKKIAVSGYFDPIHVGHIEYINNAKKLGDWLVVIVNNNNQCALKKGKYFMDEKDRVLIVKNIKAVDEVFKNYGRKLSKFSSCKKVDSIIVAVAHNEFKRIKAEEYMKLCKSSEPVFGDLKSIFSKNDLELAGFNVFRL